MESSFKLGLGQRSRSFFFFRGVTFKKSDSSSVKSLNNIAILRAGNIQNGQLVFDDLVYVEADKVKTDQLICKGDLIIAMSSGSKSVVGKVAEAKIDLPEVAFGAFCGLLRPYSDLDRWLSAFFRLDNIEQLSRDYRKG